MSIPQSSRNYTVASGTSSSIVPLVSDRSPASSDITGPNGPFQIGQRWINRSQNLSYTLTSLTPSNGSLTSNWLAEGPGTGALSTLTGNTGGAISPSSGNINILGSGTTSVSGSGSTLTINPTAGGYPITPYVVGPVGLAGYQTIQAAITAANSAGGGVVYIQPGSYTENLTLFSGVDLYATPAVSQNQGATVTITGTHTPPASGHVGFNSICFISTTNVFSSNAAGTTHLAIVNCESAVTNGYFFNLPNWVSPGILEVFDFNASTAGAPGSINDGGINNTGGATVLIFDCSWGNGSNPMILSGTSFIQGSGIGCPVSLVTGSNTSSFTNEFLFTVTASDNSIFSSINDSFVTGSSTALTMSSSGSVALSGAAIQTSANPSISGAGAGTLTLSGINYVGNSSIAGTLTLNTTSASVFGEVRANADVGGSTGFNSLTGTNSTTISSGDGSIKMSSANPGTNAAWIKIYIGTTPYWIPAWATNSP